MCRGDQETAEGEPGIAEEYVENLDDPAEDVGIPGDWGSLVEVGGVDHVGMLLAASRARSREGEQERLRVVRDAEVVVQANKVIVEAGSKGTHRHVGPDGLLGFLA